MAACIRRGIAFIAMASAVGWAAAPSRCISCHPAEVANYAATGMSSSISRQADQPAGRFTHVYSGTAISVRYDGTTMRQRLTRTRLSADYPIAYVIGSGHRAFGYLVEIGGSLFQSPLTYYTQRKAWDMAPAYAKNPAPDFNRPVTAECLFCHGGTANRYVSPAAAAEGITCERCHGPSDKHLASPSRLNIVNPARLAPGLRDGVCEQCHLSGQARILNPGKEFADFQPGESLENVAAVYVAAAADETPLKVISQSEQLRLSKCWRKGEGRLWCGTCHDPHGKLVENARYYRAQCLGCHAATLSKEHQQSDANCIGCHMKTRETVDGAHTAFTDHQIRRKPLDREPPPARAVSLSPWREAPSQYAVRNLGLAYLSVGERDGSADMLQRAFPLLVDAQKQFPQDPDITAGLALTLYFKGMNRQAASAFELAARLRADGRFYRDAAAAWQADGNSANAIRDLNKAIDIDLSDENAYRLLANIFREIGDESTEKRTLDRYLAFRPQSIEFRQRRFGTEPDAR